MTNLLKKNIKEIKTNILLLILLKRLTYFKIYMFN